MSLHEYKVSQHISAQDPPFYALIMACFRQADTDNLGKLRRAFPFVFQEYLLRYHAPGGRLGEELREQVVEELPETVLGRTVVVTEVGPRHVNLALGGLNVEGWLRDREMLDEA